MRRVLNTGAHGPKVQYSGKPTSATSKRHIQRLSEGEIKGVHRKSTRDYILPVCVMTQRQWASIQHSQVWGKLDSGPVKNLKGSGICKVHDQVKLKVDTIIKK
eukprot:2773098-Pyramimonas_sp.AAC.1